MQGTVEKKVIIKKKKKKESDCDYQGTHSLSLNFCLFGKEETTNKKDNYKT